MITNATPTQYNAGLVASKGTINVAVSGQYFYFTVASGPLFVKPSGGTWVLYYAGTGSGELAGFNGLSIYNPTPNAVTFQLVASPIEFTDKRQIYNTGAPNVIKPATWTASTGNAAASMPDWSGKSFNDPAGTAWLAVQRIAIFMQVLLEGVGNGANILLGTGATYSQPNTVLEIPAVASGTVAPPVQFAASGAFNAFTDNIGGNSQIYVSVFEIYQAVAPNAAAYQPPS